MKDLRGLWRGKRADTKKWVTGYMRKIDPFVLYSHRKNYDDGSGIEIDVETLGACTGKHDKNKKLVFDGDIIKGWGKHLFVVYFSVRYRWFTLRELSKKPTHMRMFLASLWKFEVIGNIHDNPELLKGADNE